MSKANDPWLLLKANLKQLRLPTMLAEFEKLSREAAAANEDYPQYLLRLTELELATRQSNALKNRIKQADFGVQKDFDTFDFTATPSLPKQKVLELARGEWIDQRQNVCLIGSAGTGKTHVATALGISACGQGKKVRFHRVTELITQLMEAREDRQLMRMKNQLAKLDLLILDELGYVPASKLGSELLFDVISAAYERTSVIVTTNLPFEQWTEVLGSQRLTGAVLDRLTHHCHILEALGDSYRLKDARRRSSNKKKPGNPGNSGK